MYKYRFVLVPFISLMICQIIKFIIESIKHKKLRFDRLFNGAGGMPSTHSTFSASLTTLLMYEYGLSSPLFAISLIFSMIVMYDAMGVRYETGLQATVINDLVEKLNKEKRHFKFKELKEQIGHKPFEVICGMILGFLISTIFSIYIF